MKNLLFLFFVAGFWGCASTEPPTLFEPVSAPGIFTIYSNGTPIASLSTDSLLVLLSLDQTEIAGDSYFRLWVLTQNLSDTVTLLEPSKIFTVNATPKGFGDSSNTPWWSDTNSYRREDFAMRPKSPTEILNEINEEEATHTILTAIGGALEAASQRNTTVTSNRGEEYVIHDAREKRDAVNQQTAASLASIANWYDVFKSSVTSGILRKNTLFPGQSVNGYIYFQNNMRYSDPSQRGFLECYVGDFNYKVVVQLPDGPRTVEFRVIEGE